MSELKPEYEAAVVFVAKEDDWRPDGCAIASLRKLAGNLQHIADRPPKMLTTQELAAVAQSMPGGPTGYCKGWGYEQFGAAIQEAFIAKQSEPDTVPFDYYLWSKGGWQAIDSAGCKVNCILANMAYTMRKSA